MSEIETIDQVTQDIDAIIQKIQQLERCRETSLSITKLEEAAMWMDRRLRQLYEASLH